MAFQLRCPKCDSTNLRMEQDGQIKVGERYRANPVMHCLHCGKVIYGEEAVEAEYVRQRREFEDEEKSREQERIKQILAKKRAEMEMLRNAVGNPNRPPRYRRMEERKKAAVAAASRAAASQSRKARRAAAAEAPPAPAVAAQPNLPLVETPAIEEGANMCAWPECGKPARKNSKYCSRNCSNKYARWRHRQRKVK